MGQTTIRRATAADRTFLTELSAEVFARYASRPRALMEQMLENGSTLVAEHVLAGRAIRLGLAVVDLSAPMRSSAFEAPRLAHLAAIAVVPDAMGCGLGRELLEAAEDYARAHGAIAMSLQTAVDNHPAQRLFKRAGYSPILPLAEAYKGSQDAIYMSKSLSLART